ncbi:MAG: hypothetical protein KJ950_10320 [Proteobacteria bacterium]|nr:hypothetical protein [Pseudomonadota bacterium]MBU1687772.1 hypothetical protein [Pseudomonadota bacterium]
MKSGWNIAGLSAYVLFLFTAPVVSTFINYTVGNWRVILGGRVALAVLLGVWAGYSCGRMAELGRLGLVKGIGVVLVVSFLLNIFPIIDLIRGPVSLDGELQRYSADHSLSWRPNGSFYPEMSTALAVKGSGPHSIKLSSIGWQANRVEDALEKCSPGDRITGSALQSMGFMLNLACCDH